MASIFKEVEENTPTRQQHQLIENTLSVLVAELDAFNARQSGRTTVLKMLCNEVMDFDDRD